VDSVDTRRIAHRDGVESDARREYRYYWTAALFGAHTSARKMHPVNLIAQLHTSQMPSAAVNIGFRRTRAIATD